MGGHVGDVRMTRKRYVAIISDADVLIDYAKTAKFIMGLVVEHLCDLYTIEEVFEEVEQLTRRDLRKLGIRICKPSLNQIKEATKRGGPLSEQDRLCLTIARDNEWACWTNDKPLRQACRDHGVSVIWGLEIMLDLVRVGALSSSEAERIGKTIHQINPRYVDLKIVERFISNLKRIKTP